MRPTLPVDEATPVQLSQAALAGPEAVPEPIEPTPSLTEANLSDRPSDDPLTAAEARAVIFDGIGDNALHSLVFFAQLSDIARKFGGAAEDTYRLVLKQHEVISAQREERRLAAFQFLQNAPSTEAIKVCHDAMGISQLSGAAADTAYSAAFALARMNSPLAVQTLVEAARSEGSRQLPAIAALRSLTDSRHLDLWLELLEQPKLRSEAAQSLKALFQAVPSLASEKAGEHALGRLWDVFAFKDHNDFLSAWIAQDVLKTHGGSFAVDLARKSLLQTSSETENLRALALLEELDSGTELARTLLGALHSRSRSAAVYAQIGRLLSESQPSTDCVPEIRSIAAEGTSSPRSLGEALARFAALLPAPSFINWAGESLQQRLEARRLAAEKVLENCNSLNNQGSPRQHPPED